MSGFHLTVKPVSFGKGQSAVHAAAYNARTQLKHEREDKLTKDYSNRDAALFCGIFAPKDAPAWTQDREQLWNRAEAAERQANGRPARNMIVAFPHELDQQQREWLIKDFAREQFARQGMIADVAMHAPDSGGDQRNYHAHILLTMRKLDGEEFAKTKCREWNSKEVLNGWREDWAERGAKALERAGFTVEAERWRHGHETLGQQRAAALERGDTGFAESLDREATIHKGSIATALDRRGVPTDRMEAMRDIIERNDIRVEEKAIGAERADLEREEKELRQRGPASGGLDWTDRAGMVAQEASAMKAFRDLRASASPTADATPSPSKSERSDVTPDGTGSSAATDARRARFAKMFERKPDDPGNHEAGPDRSQGRDKDGGHSR